MNISNRHSLDLPINNNIPIHHKISEDDINTWKKWQYLVPRWSSPELSSITSTTASVVTQPEEKHCNSWDEENTIGGDGDHHVDEVEKKVLISLCKSLMLYGAPCHRIVCILS
jgi:hypothetical protein